MKPIHTVLMILTILAYSCSSETKKKESATAVEILESPVGANSSLPHLVVGGDNRLYLSWVEKKDSTLVEFKYSRFETTAWSESELIDSGTDWFVNWADYPMIAVGESEDMIGHYAAKSSSGTYSYDVNLVRKAVGTSWSEPMIPHNDATPTEHGFVTMLPWENQFLLAWLDGRNTGGESHGHEGDGGAMTIRTAFLDIDGNLSGEYELDNKICDCCQTGSAMTSSGPVIVYRDRSEDEIRDISIVRYQNGTWTKPEKVHNDGWSINGCPVNGPKASAIENDLAVAWFTAAQDTARVYVAFSVNAGQDFGQAIRVDDGSPIGRVDLAMLEDRSVLVSWVENINDGSEIRFRRIYSDENMEDSRSLATTSASRSSGFPQMAIAHKAVFWAWMEADSVSTIRTARMSLSDTH